jgi:serine/threonine protein kinase
MNQPNKQSLHNLQPLSPRSTNGSKSNTSLNELNSDDELARYGALVSYVSSVSTVPVKQNYIGFLYGYKLIKEIGSGFFGKVYDAIRQSDGKNVALKVIKIDPENSSAVNDLKREVSILTKISDPDCQPYLVCFNGYKYIENEQLFLIDMNMVKGDTLGKFADRVRYNPKFTRYLLLIMKDLIKAISYLHKNGIIHNDIKPDNIIISSNLTPVLVDMGVACTDLMPCPIEDVEKLCCKGIKGPNMYISPETIFTKGGYFKESDIWDLGLTFYITVIQKYPIDIGEPLTARKLVSALQTRELNKLKSGNEILDYIVNRALDKNINTRITLPEIETMLKDI